MKPYQICTKTIMDTSDPGIVFDSEGICQYWHNYQREKLRREKMRAGREDRLLALTDRIKSEGTGKAYDCLIGVSGGIDSSFVAMKCKDYGLRPLAVHYDGGWDASVGSHNLDAICNSLELRRIDVRVEASEIRDLILAYMRASVIDIGVYADHAILATMYNTAHKEGIRYVLIGANFETESINPSAWVYAKLDLVNLRAIHRRFGKLPALPSYPTCGFTRYLYLTEAWGLSIANFIDFFDFNQVAVQNELTQRFGWEPYARKHGEVVFTKFYQQYILPRKFGVDKRRMHYSSLICSGQMTRNEALSLLEQPIYDPDELEADKKQVLDKLQLSEGEFEKLMDAPIRSHLEFPNDRWMRSIYQGSMRITAPVRKTLGLKRTRIATN